MKFEKARSIVRSKGWELIRNTGREKYIYGPYTLRRFGSNERRFASNLKQAIAIAQEVK